ncbi:MAG: aminotransferase class V-fold PLP-dependent enzyme [Gammaproteobacteria bacterium]|nr:MAG: aminotransferase class V-fold PLP-dependent enzyme [Gammaproteobacteria bacterium]
MKSSDIRIVLVEPSHPGNIGAVARAMKNMALEDLVLVKPKQFPHEEATARASGAGDVLTRARVVDSVPEAIAGCGFIAATTSRDRDQYFRVLDVREAAERIVSESRRTPAAVLFGAERTGLRNEELEAAHVLIRIPASEGYPSLNLAMAVQLVAYELLRAQGARVVGRGPGAAPLASPEEMERLNAHLAQVLEEIDFRDRTQSGTHLTARIRRFLQRAELDENEVHILRGILTAVQSRRRHAGAGPSGPIYLDYAATTPVDPAVAAAMSACLTLEGDFGNAASATHPFGRQAAARIETARAQVAALIGAEPEEIVFTSGATESNNLTILGLARANADRRRHIVTSRIEHKAVLDPCKRLEKEGFNVTYLTPDRSGRIDPDAVRAALRPDTVLVSIMYVNNEIGVMQDVEAIGALCRERGVAFHSDCAQAAGKVPLDVRKLCVDFVSFTAHKLYGPKGVGALYVRPGARPGIQPVAYGGGQERGLRPGTLATHQIVGFGVACQIAARQLAGEQARLTGLRERLWTGLAAVGGAHLNGEGAPRVPGILNVSFEGVEGESLVTGLGGLAISTGSACNSASAEPSYVLRALGRDTQLAQSSLRLSLGRYTTAADVDFAVEAVRHEVGRLRALSPAAAAPASWTAPPAAEAAPAPNPSTAPGGLGDGRDRTALAGEAGGPGQEVWVRFHLLVEDSTVKDARFQAYGCPHTLQVAAWLTRQLPGRTRSELVPGTPASWAEALSVPVEKLGRLFVVEDALHACLRRWPQA